MFDLKGLEVVSYNTCLVKGIKDEERDLNVNKVFKTGYSCGNAWAQKKCVWGLRGKG